MDLVVFISTGLIAGILSGLLGIGGAVFIIPSLIIFLGFDQKIAQGTTLMLMVPPIGLMAAYQYYKNGLVNMKASAIIALCFFIGGYFGAKLAVRLDPTLLKKIFSIFLMIISLKIFFS